ncbi:MAG: hypothetical protein WA890_27395, partial [Micromonospora sp.]
TPRLAALLPARRPRLRATTGGHDEARHRRGSAITGLPVRTVEGYGGELSRCSGRPGDEHAE